MRVVGLAAIVSVHAEPIRSRVGKPSDAAPSRDFRSVPLLVVSVIDDELEIETEIEIVIERRENG
ncbi:hypothetical protein [Natronoglomus mannanivorans]|uniref:Uncharacterized protein n=1 Tax=Natronoglomus mannanivorans TaxID=2979990 RepID=A0AAP2Z056_9EURY|nr:hypothetical protein [Halobacteria archaeon AArc-xg1-1]